MNRLLRLLSLYRPAYGWMALGVLLSLATVLANVMLMAVSGWFITAMAIAGAAQVSMNYFTPAAMIRGAAIVRTAGRYAERLVTHQATLKLLARLRSWFFERLEPLAPAALQGLHSGDLLSRIRADIDTLDNFYIRLLTPVITALLATLILTLFLSTYDPVLAGALLSLLVAAGIGVPILARVLGNTPGRRKVVLAAEQRSMLIDTTQGLGELLLYDAAAAQLQRLDANSRALAGEQAKLSAVGGLSQAGMLLAANLAVWLVLWLAIPMVASGTLPKADLAMLALFSLAAFEAVMPLPAAFQAYGETLAAAERLFEIVDREPAVRSPTSSPPLPQRRDIVFDAVCFSYPGNTEPALHGLDLAIPDGGRLTLRGPSGSGKSSIVQLLVRFDDPQSGSIRLGGIGLAQWDIEDLRRQFAVVPQQTHLFTGTLRDNLSLARPGVEEGAMRKACDTAQILDFVDRLPDGLDTWIGEAGATLSGGEAKRLSIARALLKDSPVLLLDEPTEGLDPTTAAKLLAAIDAATSDKTVLLVTHQSLHGVDFGPEVEIVAGSTRATGMPTPAPGDC